MLTKELTVLYWLQAYLVDLRYELSHRSSSEKQIDGMLLRRWVGSSWPQQHMRSRGRRRFTSARDQPDAKAADAATKTGVSSSVDAATAAAAATHPSTAAPAAWSSTAQYYAGGARVPSSKWLWTWGAGAVISGVALVAFGPELKLGMSKHTADVASRSLQDETLQHNSRELASQIVQTVLSDPNVLDQAASFLQQLVSMSVTRAAIRALIVQTLSDPETLKHVVQLAKSALAVLLEDPSTRRHVLELVQAAIADPQTKASLIKLLQELLRDDTLRQNVAGLLGDVFKQEPVKASVKSTIGESVHSVLSREDIQDHAKEFVANVVHDRTVQAQSGDAIWSTVLYAVTPGWFGWMWKPPLTDEQIAAAEAQAQADQIAAVVADLPEPDRVQED